MAVQLRKNQELHALNTFGIQAKSAYFVEIQSEQDLIELFESAEIPEKFLVVGGGSNLLFTQDFDGLVIQMRIPGIEHRQDNQDVYVTAGAGVIWDNLVWHAVHHGFAGIENMALIPGTVGAAPIQNIGAYGMELMDVFQECRAFDLLQKKIVTLKKEDCHFSYRDSIFKSAARGRYIITSVTLKLSLVFVPKTEYGAIKQELNARGIDKPTLIDLAEVVSSIRVEKLPDPSTIGNAGSFFKNPIIPKTQFFELKAHHPDIAHYHVDENQEKIAAGWLIESCGWKGKRIGDCGTWKNQALVIVNYANASGQDIYDFSERIIIDVKNKFGIILEREVNVV
jgi:UDP-N-acetylmuramate dehydrogenase